MKTTLLLLSIVILSAYKSYTQISNNEKDSLYIVEIEDAKGPHKVLHAEPLFIDLIRDLGARKGEKEWNVGLGLTDNLTFDSYEALIEYEWAPVNRLGLEVELPFTFYTGTNGTHKSEVPSNRLNSLKTAIQYSFFVNEKLATSMAIGYIYELEFSDFAHFGHPVFEGLVYNPFLVVAKRWKNNFHSLIYTGPKLEHAFHNQELNFNYEINSSFHYMISGSRNFIGLEINKGLNQTDFDMTIRPQMRLGISEHLMVGIVMGIPVVRENERLSSFIRLIWEPKTAVKHE